MKKFYSWQDVENGCHEILRQMHDDRWDPEYIVGITRGGVIPAVMLSHFLNCPMKPLMVNLRDHVDCCSDCGMAEDAFGYVPKSEQVDNNPFDPNCRKNILIVDDINDTGSTLEWIRKDWQSLCLPDSDPWHNVWGETVKIAVLINNAASPVTVNYSGFEINKYENPEWCVFPYEEWWIKRNILY